MMARWRELGGQQGKDNGQQQGLRKGDSAACWSPSTHLQAQHCTAVPSGQPCAPGTSMPNQADFPPIAVVLT